MQTLEWTDRRHPCRWVTEGEDGFWVPQRSEILTQFFTRYLFVSLAVICFSTLDAVPPVFLTVEQLLIALGVYFAINSGFLRLAPQGGTLLSIADIHLYQNKSQRPDAAEAPFYRTLAHEPEAS